jgi:hypothetical protein
MSSQPSERVAVVATIDPQDVAQTAKTSDWVPVRKWRELQALVLAGAITGTLDAKLQQATDSAGTGAADITGKAVTQFAATDDNKQAVINLKAEEVGSGYTHVALKITPTGGTTNLCGGLILGVKPQYPPASDDDLADVKEIVT